MPLIDATTAAHTARAAGQSALDPQILATICNHYRGAIANAITDNSARARWPPTPLALARRFRDHEDTILRFVADLLCHAFHIVEP